MCSQVVAGDCSYCTQRLHFIVGLAVLAAIAIFMVFQAIRSAGDPANLLSMILKIFLSYLQLVTLASSLDLDWPGMVCD